jgi:hypothetical protein
MMHALRRRGVRSTLQATQLCRGPRGWGPRAPAHLACPLRCAIHRPCLLRERESASQQRTLTSPDGFNQGRFDPEIWSGQHVSSDVAQHLLQLVHFQDGLSLLEAELCEESLQTAHWAFSPDAPGLMGAGGSVYHVPPGVGWTDEQSVVARASALLLLDSNASRTSLALGTSNPGRLRSAGHMDTVDLQADTQDPIRVGRQRIQPAKPGFAGFSW